MFLFYLPPVKLSWTGTHHWVDCWDINVSLLVVQVLGKEQATLQPLYSAETIRSFLHPDFRHDSTDSRMALLFYAISHSFYFFNFSLSVCFSFTPPLGLSWLWGWRATWWFVLGQQHAFIHLSLWGCVLCPVRGEILQLHFSWASGEIQLQGYGGCSCPLAFITWAVTLV